jgi:tetratricopeptide (TPR) repeat protein
MTVFVGRTQELDRLGRILEGVQAGKGRVVFITGEAGAGKSTLVSRFLVESQLRWPDMHSIGAACSEQYGAGEPYQPFVEAFRDLVSGGTSGESRWSRLRDLASDLAPHWLAAIPVAGNIISATMSTAVELKKLTTAAPTEEALFFQYTELFLAAAAEKPVFLFIDDLHWADSATVSLLAHLGRRIASERVLILGTYRPADVDVTKHPIRQARLELERYGVAEEFALEPLDRAALASLVAEELGAPPTPELVDWLTRNAGSNPLFFTELLRWLVEQGIAKEHYGEWALSREPAAVEVPRSAEAAIERRLGRLDPDTYRILEYASVEGNEFGSTTLAQLLDMDELELEEKLDPLVRLHRLVRPLDTRELPNGDLSSIYLFSHSLIRDVLHRNLQGKRRILMHRKMAEILERIYGSQVNTVAHRMAVHLDEGRLAERAYAFALTGADHAARVYAHRDAIELIGRALKNARDDAQKIEVLSRLGDENRIIGHFANALAALRDAITLCEARGDRPRVIELKRRVVLVDREEGRIPAPELRRQLEQLAMEAREVAAARELAQILWLLASMSGVSSEEAIAWAREALRICEPLGDADLTVRANYSLGRTLTFGPHPETALPHIQAALAYYDERGDRHRGGLCHNLIAIVNVILGDYRRASDAFAAAAAAFDAVGDPVNEASVRNNYGVLLTRIGDYDAAEENLTEAIRLIRRLDAAGRLQHPLENMAELAEARGDLADAAERWRALLERGRELGYWTVQVIAQCGVGRTLLARGDLEGARSARDAARVLLPDGDDWSEARCAWHHLAGLVAMNEGNAEEAQQLLLSAEEGLAPRDAYDSARFRLMRAEVVAASDLEAAVALAEAAAAIFRKMGARPMQERAEALLASPRRE